MSQKLSKEYEDIWKLPAEKVEQFNTDFKYIKKVEKEISKMKKGSIALISQITTISKQRIYDPKVSSDILANLRVSDSTLNLIFTNLNLKIFIFVTFCLPVLLLSIFSFNHENIISIVVYISKFIFKPKSYL